MKAKINTRAKKQLKTYEQIVTSPYAYLFPKSGLSMDESMLIQIVCRELKGKDGEISNQAMKSLWGKIKNRMKHDIQKGSHNNKLFQLIFEWDKYYDYFAILTARPSGVLFELFNFWRRDFRSMRNKYKSELMKLNIFHNWIEL